MKRSAITRSATPTWLPLLVLLTLGLTSERGAAWAQEIQMPKDVPLPSQAISRDRDVLNAPWKVWSAQERLVVRSGPAADAPPLPKQLAFLEPAEVAFRHPASNGSASLLLCRTENDESFDIKSLIGWVKESDVLLTNVALPVKRGGVALPIHRKGMAVITQKSIDAFPPRGVPTFGGALADKRGEGAAVENAVLFRAPRKPTAGDPPTFGTSIPLSSFYLVYGETDDFVLVGTNQRFKVTEPADVVLGWLPKVNHAEWNNRIGYEWNIDTFASGPTKAGGKRLEGGFVFKTASEAASFLQLADPPLKNREPVGAAFSESIENGMPLRIPEDAMRMPLLEDKVVSAGVDKFPIAKVGWLGGRAIDQQQAAVARRKLKELAVQSRNLDIMFLIDHTQTMGEHFPVVANAVQRIVADLREKYLGESGIYNRSMRVSVSFYGDESFKDSAAVIREFAPVTSSSSTNYLRLTPEQRRAWATRTDLGLNDMLAELAKHPTFGGGGVEEDVLIAMAKAIKTFPADESRKLLFVIGDMGDKSLLGKEFARRRDALADKLANNRVPIWFVALHVKTKATDSPNGKEAAKLFHDQMHEISQQTRVLLRKSQASEAELDFSKVVPLDAKPPTEEILRAYEAMQREVDRYQRALRNADPSQLTHREQERLAAQKIDLNSLRHPLFAEGYVSHHARPSAVTDRFIRTNQVTRRVLMSGRDLDNLKRMCAVVLEAIESPDSGDEGIGSLIRQEIAAIYGESKAVLTLKEAFELRANILVNSPIFKVPLDDFGRVRIQPKDLESLRASYNRLVDIEAGVERVWEVQQDPTTKRWKAVSNGKPIKKDRSFTLPRDPFEFQWYWLKESELP